MTDKPYKVWHEKGGYIVVQAKSMADAPEEYYKALESMLGHYLKTCGCFGERQPIDRDKVFRIERIEPLS